MRNHERTSGIRIFGKRNLERRSIFGLVRGHHRVIDKTQVVMAAGFVIRSRLFALQFLGSVIVDYRLVDFVSRPIFREYRRLDDEFASARRLVIGIRKLQMLFPVILVPAAFGGVQVIRCRIGAQSPGTRSERVVRRLLFKLHAQHKNFERVRRMRK